MPTKHQVLEQLKRDELIAAVERFELPVADRRVKRLLVEALASSPEAPLAGILSELKRDRLKELCRALELDDGGREKTLLTDRLGPESSGRPAAAEPDAAEPAAAEPATPGPRRSILVRPGSSRPPVSRAPVDRPPAGRPPAGRPPVGRPPAPPARPSPRATGDRPGRDRPRTSPGGDRGGWSAGPRRPAPAQRKPVNIQDGFLFESLKENRLLLFALVTGDQIKGWIRRFDQFTVLVDTGKQEILIYKSAISGIGVAGRRSGR